MRACALILLACAIPLRAHAQETEPEETSAEETSLEEARTYHEEGIRALREENLALAEASFRRALAITFRATTAYNLALVLIDLRKGPEAVELFDRLLEMPEEELPRTHAELGSDRTMARALCGELRLIVQGPLPVWLEVDGERRAELQQERGLALLLQPGRRQIVVGHAQERQRHEVTLEAGGSRELRVQFLQPTNDQLEEVVAEDPLIQDPPPDPRRRRRLGLGLGLTAAAIAAAVVTLIVVLPVQGDGFSEGPIPNISALSQSE